MIKKNLVSILNNKLSDEKQSDNLVNVVENLDFNNSNGNSSGSGGQFIITGTPTDPSQVTGGTVDKTAEEILAAIETGKIVYLKIPVPGESDIFLALMGYTNADNHEFIFVIPGSNISLEILENQTYMLYNS